MVLGLSMAAGGAGDSKVESDLSRSHAEAVWAGRGWSCSAGVRFMYLEQM